MFYTCAGSEFNVADVSVWMRNFWKTLDVDGERFKCIRINVDGA